MKLPPVAFADNIVKGKQVKFNGLNHNYGADDGELWDMRNLTSDYYPLLATRQKRRHLRSLSAPYGIFSWDGLAWVDGTTFYYKGEAKGAVEAGEKTFTALGVYIIILPDKKYYNTVTDEFGSLESSWSGTSLTFTNGKLFDEDAEANTIQCSGVNWSSYFKAGDAVTISGATRHPENNKTPVIREIDGNKMYFYENIFTLDGDGTTPYTETGSLQIARTMPDLKYICENENRLWGCDDTTIYCSKLGDIFNWNVYEGLDTDSYAVDTGSAGKFTACISYLGYPVFFKEDHIYKVYGSRPSNYEVMAAATLGVASGSHKSLAIAGEMLFYLSTAGFMAYSGGIPQPIGQAFGLVRLHSAVGGSDGLKYYVSAEDYAGETRFYVYDAQRALWHIEDETRAIGFARYDGNTYMLSTNGAIDIIGTIRDTGEATEEADFPWFAEFGDFVDDSPNKKGVSKIQIRLELETGATATVYLQFDSSGEWIQAGKTLHSDAKRSYYLPIVPRRGDHYRMKIEGAGGCRIYSLVREYYGGSELKSLPGRN